MRFEEFAAQARPQSTNRIGLDVEHVASEREVTIRVVRMRL